MQLTVQRVRILYVTFTSISSFAGSFIMATYVPFLNAQGMNDFQRHAINSFFFATNFLAEGPTGAVADVLGQKKAFACSSVIFGSGFIYYAHAHTFSGFVIAEVIAALGRTLANGCLDGWMSNKLSDLGAPAQVRRDTFRLEYIMRSSLSMLGSILGATLATGNTSSKLPWLVAGSITICNGLAVWLVLPSSTTRSSKAVTWRILVARLRRKITRSIATIRQSPALKYNFAVSIGFACSVQALNMQWTLYYLPSVGAGTNLGMLGSGISLAMVVGAVISRPWKHDAIRMHWLLLSIGCCMVFCAVTNNVFVSIALFLLHELLRGAFQTIQTDYIQQYAPNRKRSTIKSISSMPHHLGGVVGLLISGGAALMWNVRYTWIASGLCLLVCTVAARRLRPQ